MSRMTLSDRMAIEAGIYGKLSFQEIAKRIGKTPKYVSQEILRNRTPVKGEHPRGNDCRMAVNCKRGGLCGDTVCRQKCHYCCRNIDCRSLCAAYDNTPCDTLSKSPYVCNVCTNRRKCKADREYYIAAQADAMARRRYSEARQKPQIQGDALSGLDALVTPLIKKGQPLTHIFAEHGDEIPVSQRTLYHYIDSGALCVGNLDLRRKVGYRPRRKKRVESEAFLNQECRKGRSYEDFLSYMNRYPETDYVEMDTVNGRREQGKRMLTLLFVKQNLMLILLMRNGRADTVVEQFDWLTSALGPETFRELFSVILTDNGSEFKHTKELEFASDGERRTRIFYCDPQASWQKPHIEKNHEYIRYILPKGKSFNPYTQEDMALLMSHINSTRRAKLNGCTPYTLACGAAFEHLKAVLELREIPADEVDLTPRLLKKT